MNELSAKEQKFKNTIGKKFGIIICRGPDGEYAEARSFREAEEITGVHRNTIDYATKHSGRTRNGWSFCRQST